MIALASGRRHVADEPTLSRREHQRGRMPRRHIVCAQTDAHLIVPDLDGMVPETTAPRRRAGDLVHIVDQYIEVALLTINLSEQRRDLGVVAMIHLHRHAMPSGRIHQSGAFANRQFTGGGTSRDIHGGPQFTEGDGDTAPNATTGSSHHRHLAVEGTHHNNPYTS